MHVFNLLMIRNSFLSPVKRTQGNKVCFLKNTVIVRVFTSISVSSCHRISPSIRVVYKRSIPSGVPRIYIFIEVLRVWCDRHKAQLIQNNGNYESLPQAGRKQLPATQLPNTITILSKIEDNDLHYILLWKVISFCALNFGMLCPRRVHMFVSRHLL